MATLLIGVEEYSNATNFKLYDNTVWSSFSHSDITSVNLTVTYDSTDYTYKLWDTADATDETSMDATFENLFGTSVNSYISIGPDDITDGSGTVLDATRFPDGYYQIKLDVVHTGDGALTVTDSEGFLAEAYCKASQLPMLIDLSNFDHIESRLQRMVIAMLDAAVRAAELGRYSDFDDIVDTINNFYSARDLTDLW